MKINTIKIISCLLSAFMINATMYETANAWTTEVYFATPTGHEVLTKDGAYAAGSYYKDDFDKFLSVIADNGFGQQSYNFTKQEVMEAGWGRRLWKRVKKNVNKITNSAVAIAGQVGIVVAAVAAWPITTIYLGLKACGFWNWLMPYYGTYNERTKGLIAGARYQDLEDKWPGSNSLDRSQKKTEKQKFHFLRRNNLDDYNIEIMRQEIDNEEYGIKYKGIIEPIIDAHRAIGAGKKKHLIGHVDKVNVFADHFAMGRVLHTIQDGYAHNVRNPDKGWIINEVMVYEPKGIGQAGILLYSSSGVCIEPNGTPRPEFNYQHESMLKTMMKPYGSHDRIYGTDAGIRGLNGKMKPAARAARRATTDILRLWKHRDAGWKKETTADLIKTHFKLEVDNPNKPWAIIVNRICAHR